MSKPTTIEIRGTLTYDADLMHGDDPESRAWFRDILQGEHLQLGEFGDFGDMIGSVKISHITEGQENAD